MAPSIPGALVACVMQLPRQHSLAHGSSEDATRAQAHALGFYLTAASPLPALLLHKVMAELADVLAVRSQY